MTKPDTSDEALKLAVLFHETYERLAPSFGYETRTETRTFDPTSKNGRLMVAVCGEIKAVLAQELLDTREREKKLLEWAQARLANERYESNDLQNRYVSGLAYANAYMTQFHAILGPPEHWRAILGLKERTVRDE